MPIPDFKVWIAGNPSLALGAACLLFLVIYLLTHLIFARGLVYIAARTKNKYDDIVVKKLRPNRAAWLAPFIIAYTFAYLAPEVQTIIQKVTLFFILWLTALTLIGLLDAFNEIYESTPPTPASASRAIWISPKSSSSWSALSSAFQSLMVNPRFSSWADWGR